MTPIYADPWLTVHQGDCREVLPQLPDGSIDCVVTSPPYWMQRSYLGADDALAANEIGQELDYAAYEATIVALASELRRVLVPQGSLWLNLGDKFVGNGGQYRYPGDLGKQHRRGLSATTAMRRRWTHGYPAGTQRKSLILAPYRIALALMADGWILRDEVIWHKTNALPESVLDRFARRHEVLFRFTRSQRAYFDLAAVKQPLAAATLQRAMPHRAPTFSGPGSRPAGPGDVWSTATSGARGRGFKHSAMFPPTLIERPILSTCPPGGVVLDPFAGTGTTAEVANRLGRRAVLIELDPSQIEAIRRRTGRPEGAVAAFQRGKAAAS